MPSWSAKSADEHILIPNETSRFTLSVKKTAKGKWQAFVNDEEVDECREFLSMAAAQKSAIAAYDDYYSDFEGPTDGF